MEDDQEKTRKAVLLIYLLIAIGIALPIVVFFWFR